jgi:hypothetical protein
MTNRVRRVLEEAGFIEARGADEWGYVVAPETTPGVVQLRYVPPSAAHEYNLRIGNARVSQYVRTLQANGFDVRRVPGVTKVDSLLILMEAH